MPECCQRRQGLRAKLFLGPRHNKIVQCWHMWVLGCWMQQRYFRRPNTKKRASKHKAGANCSEGDHVLVLLVSTIKLSGWSSHLPTLSSLPLACALASVPNSHHPTRADLASQTTTKVVLLPVLVPFVVSLWGHTAWKITKITDCCMEEYSLHDV